MKINVDFIYPIGSIYISMNSTNPSNFFGGTWQQIAGGRALIGAGKLSQNNNTNLGTLGTNELSWNWTAGQTLGEVYHTLTVNEMPSHNHTFKRGTEGNSYFGVTGKEPSATPPYDVTTSSTGGNYPHNNIQPSLIVYIWQRTA